MSNKLLTTLFTLLVLLVAGFAGTVLAAETGAQDTGSAVVHVTDQNGIIPQASVIMTFKESGQTHKRRTNTEGNAQFSALQPGMYSLRVSYLGYADYVKDDVEITRGNETKIDAEMTLTQFSDTVTISTANRREELLRNVAEPTTLIDLADIEDTGGRSAKDVLIEQAGAGVLVQPGGGQGSVSINGISNKGVLILIDGRRFLGKNSLGDIDLEDMDLSQFERIEVVKGAGSALYGSDALGGVINFITKKPTTGGISNDLEVNYGSYKDSKINDTLDYREGNFSASVTGAYRFTEGFDLDPSNPQTIGLPESSYYTFSTNVEHRTTDNFTIRALFDYNQRDIDKYYFSGATQLGTDVYNSQRNINRLTFSPEADWLIADSTLLNVRYTYGKYNREETQIYPARTVDVQPWLQWNNEFDAKLRHDWSLNGQSNTLQMGYEFRNDKMDRQNVAFPGATGNEADRDINVFWAQNLFKVSDRLSVTLGFRYDDYTDFGNEFSPKASALFVINDENRLRASYGHGFRAPDFGELYIDLGFFFKGNPDLEPEKSDTYTVGYSYTSKLALGSVDFYQKTVKNGIAFDLSRFPYTYSNLVEYTSKGVDSNVSVNLRGGFTPSVSYSYNKQEDENGEELFNYPKHSVFIKLLWNNPQLGLRANIRGQSLSETKYSDGTSRPAYQIWYFQASKHIIASGPYAISAFVQVDNLFDKKDVFLLDENGQPVQGDFLVWQAPRTYLFGIRINMDFSGSD